MRVKFLSRAQFPNGAVWGFWGKANVTKVCQRVGCVILHNDWLAGTVTVQQSLNMQQAMELPLRFCFNHDDSSASLAEVVENHCLKS